MQSYRALGARFFNQQPVSQYMASLPNPMLLDPGTDSEVYVWCGKEASDFERPRAHTLAEAYAHVQGQTQVGIQFSLFTEPPVCRA